MGVELISMPAVRADGPAILIRIPDDENTSVVPRYFESMNVNGIVYPSPFAPMADVITVGWQQRLFRQTRVPISQRPR